MPTQESTATKMPKDGWVHELEDAESAAKRSRSAGAQLRIAIAAYKLRDFKKLKTAANLGLVLDPSEGEKELLKEYVEKSKEQREIRLDRTSNNLQQKMQEPGANCDVIYITTTIVQFTNLNVLQIAAQIGDVTLMEEAVAHGAALDFPVRDINTSGILSVPAPPGSTALLLACAMLAYHGDRERRDPAYRRVVATQDFDNADRLCECAIRLVYLGANCQVKLQIPAQRRNTPVNSQHFVAFFRVLHFGGKTAQELASLSCQRELIRAIELMQKPENVHLTQCRCGSRLPWNQCHGAPGPGQSDLYIEGDDGRLDWRYSPKARCPCKLTNKVHYKCCWYTSTPIYIKDASGILVKIVKNFKETSALQLERMSILEGMDPNGPTINASQDMVSEEYRTASTDLIRSEGLTMLSDFNGRRCGVKDWDPVVYAGVMDRIDNCFAWNDLHWKLDKVELLQRTKEWNEALEKYCDDMGLTGAERKAVVQKHTANPCAPCSNPSCNNWETKPKEFQKCAQCKAAAYCSRDCQKKDWKAQHKSLWCNLT
jgi:hypothetical protein